MHANISLHATPFRMIVPTLRTHLLGRMQCCSERCRQALMHNIGQTHIADAETVPLYALEPATSHVANFLT